MDKVKKKYTIYMRDKTDRKQEFFLKNGGNDMKVFYLTQENFGCVVYADNENGAFEKMKSQRKELLETLGLPLDITRWGIEEFTPDLYDGVLCFY